MRIAISGASGLVGSALLPVLRESGHEVIQLVRSNPSAEQVQWDPSNGRLEGSFLSDIDSFIHLGGDNIADGRWDTAKKRRIRHSRVASTKLIAETIAGLEKKPEAFVCASAIGFYGNRGDEVMTESSDPGKGFLSEVCQEWESATSAAKEAGIRVVNVRIGVVLSAAGAALQKMLLPFKLGGGGVVGSGKQYWSCVSRPELVKIIKFALENESVSGPINAVSAVATNYDFTKTLGRLLGRPTFMPLPAFAAKIVFGEMGEDLMLSSTRVANEKLREAGFQFNESDIEAALKTALEDKVV